MIHLCVVNHCGEKATFYSSEPNPDHMAAPSPARFSFLPFTSPLRSPPSLVLPLDFTHSSSLPPPPPSPTVHLFNPSHLCFSASKLPPCLLPLADFLESHLAACVCVCACVLGRWGQASLAVSYNQPSRVPVMLCIVRTHH